MEISLECSNILFKDLLHAAPLLIFLLALIVAIGYIIGRIEGWSLSDSMNQTFINATTVG